ncbi:MAG: MaoC family dehydratase [Methylocystis sp.]|nr:MaoC family dehydratase [Methylocystis sp.]MCA3583777.1 MaoC family dehydratase [Methylocystis sp.]MCA3586450.1 MaoC family dehydratase [Methylocystis sp.]MCA3589949.1 MaoC family dehydratase [Methylocystis sp.]
MPSLHFEDFIPGSATPYGSLTVEREPMLAFAREFDAQPMHIDEKAAKASMAGELIASGWYTAALNMRMMADSFIMETASMGSPGVSELKWLKPVRAGDTLSGIRHVVDRRPSLTKPDRGFVNFRFEVFNQRNEAVFEQTNLIMIGRRGTQALGDSAAQPFAATPPVLPEFRDRDFDTIPFFEDLEIGDRLDLGSISFTEADIIRFALDFDPQSFHVDPVAAKDSIFGGLIASGWHTGANWMGQMVRNRTAAAMSAVLRGERPARLGPSPGFQHLRWIKPVYAGGTIRYSSAIFEKRISSSRPEWGIVRHYNTGINQKDELVFSFIGSVFWERRPA